MPAKSPEQKTLACIALNIQEGKTPASYSMKGAEWAKSMSKEKLEDYCKSPVASQG